jgi:hypothetical protein
MGLKELMRLAVAMKFENPDRIKQQYGKSKVNVFDSSTGKYKMVTGKVEVRIIYWKPSKDKPEGLYTVFTEDFVIGSEVFL